MKKTTATRTKAKPQEPKTGFAAEAERILALKVDERTSSLGGYGPAGEVIYEGHPSGCPSVLVDSRDGATATFMSNGSIGFLVKGEGGMDIRVLDASFDPVEKREINAPSNNVWIDVEIGKQYFTASLINPESNLSSPPDAIKIVKLGDPDRCMWYCATFKPVKDVAYQTAVRFALKDTPAGPALTREIYVKNAGRKIVKGSLWTAFTLHGTQKFVYNKELWYDSGMPLSPGEIVVSATVPYTDIIQIKRVSSEVKNAKPFDMTADYATFVGDTSAYMTLPQAIVEGAMLAGGAGRKLNRFSTAAVAASQFTINLKPDEAASVQQSLLYVTDPKICREYGRVASFEIPTYKEMAKTFKAAAEYIVKNTPSAKQVTERKPVKQEEQPHPAFELQLPAQRRVSHYANSLWTGVEELYENCRAHGAKLANGIELGTRDRGQDMWPKLKEDPGLIRKDLIHVMGFMYVTTERMPTDGRKLTIVEKLHGMFPRQYPSRWDNRSEVVMCDNRPYTDSPLWLINSMNMYIRETGDYSILAEECSTVKLTEPEHPIVSGITGGKWRLQMIDVVREVFACFQRHAKDSPYGLCQTMYGDWCDPIDMFGTNPVGDPQSRGHGRGVGVRLSAHVFQCLVDTIDTLEVPRIAEYLEQQGAMPDLDVWRSFASQLRQDIVKWAWEGEGVPHPGFLSYIHEFKADGSTPDYAAGDMGYTLGSMRQEREFDGLPRRDLACNAYGLNMVLTQRDYLEPLAQAGRMVEGILATMNKLFFKEKLGLLLFTKPIPNNDLARRLIGRMGIVPSGVAENGEYHHGQVMMHRYRLDVPGQADTVWKQFKPLMSAMRDESLAGPFEMPATSYASDPDDPHFGKGMYFGLSGSTDWILDVFHAIAGFDLALHDRRRPALRICPKLPAEVDQQLTFKRLIHLAQKGGGYKVIPFTLNISKQGKGKSQVDTKVTINGQPASAPEVADLSGMDKVEIEIVNVFGK